MQVRNYQDSFGGRFREIIYKNYKKLQELGVEYNKKGCKTWINLWDITKGEWVLTIALKEGTRTYEHEIEQLS